MNATDQALMQKYIRQARREGSIDKRPIWRGIVARVMEGPEEAAAAAADYRQAADAGDPVAMQALGQAYRLGEWGLPKSVADSARWYDAAVAKGDNAAAYDYGARLKTGEFYGKDGVKGARYLRQASVAKDLVEATRRDALLRVAYCYRDADCGEPRDLSRFFAALEMPAAMGSRVAKFERGLMLGRGTGVPKDDNAAYKLFSEAAGQGMPGGMYQQAIFMYQGRGTPKSESAAIQLFWKAAEAGSVSAATAMTQEFEDEPPPRANLTRAQQLLARNKGRTAMEQLTLESDP
jgi:TPR repeat protein